jgi:hypothetical protein
MLLPGAKKGEHSADQTGVNGNQTELLSQRCRSLKFAPTKRMRDVWKAARSCYVVCLNQISQPVSWTSGRLALRVEAKHLSEIKSATVLEAVGVNDPLTCKSELGFSDCLLFRDRRSHAADT